MPKYHVVAKVPMHFITDDEIEAQSPEDAVAKLFKKFKDYVDMQARNFGVTLQLNTIEPMIVSEIG